MSERGQITAFLRREALTFSSDKRGRDHATGAAWAVARALTHYAKRIERGDHLVKPKPTIPFADWRDKPSVGH